jgi:hypothetical protein
MVTIDIPTLIDLELVIEIIGIVIIFIMDRKIRISKDLGIFFKSKKSITGDSKNKKIYK